MLGRSVGNYQLVSKIGEGGMGVVYLARHVTLGRPAAVQPGHHRAILQRSTSGDRGPESGDRRSLRFRLHG